MNLTYVAAQKLLDELTKSKVIVKFSGEWHSGYPLWYWDSKEEYIIKERSPESKYPNRLFFPFEIKINNEFISPLKFPFTIDPRYIQHMIKLRDDVLSEIDYNVNLRIGKFDILSYLKNLEFDLKEILSKYKLSETYWFDDSEDGFHTKENHIEVSLARIYFNQNVQVEQFGLSRDDELFGLIEHEGHLYVDWALSRYWDEHFPVIERILKTIEFKKSIIESTDDYVKISDSCSGSSLVWTKSDTDLLELIIALHESGSIQNQNKDLTQKESIAAITDFFGRDIKDQYKKLNAARNRKKEDHGFLSKLQKALDTYYQKLEEKL